MTKSDKITQSEYKRRSQWGEIWRRFTRSKTAVIGLCLIGIMIFLAVFADYITPYDPMVSDTSNMKATPSLEHIFGTDELGRDIFARICKGAQISLVVGFISVTVSAVAGMVLGSIAGYYGGKVDTLIMRFVDIWMSIPGLLLNITIVTLLGIGIQNVIIAIAITSVPGYCRTIRASVMAIKNSEYIEASKACGASDFYLIVSHVIPNGIAPLIIQMTLRLGAAITQCASLSFLGLGVVPPTPEWGAMLSTGRSLLRDAPHVAFFPGVAIMITVLAMNLMGDGLRDALDPKLKN